MQFNEPVLQHPQKVIVCATVIYLLIVVVLVVFLVVFTLQDGVT